MELVIDANILFAVLIKKGLTEDLIFSNKFKLYAPEFIFKEFKKYEKLILDKTNKGKEEFYEFLNLIKSKIEIISKGEVKDYLKKSREICPDINDVPYFAIALKFKCGIWSNDKELKKQDVIKVFSTKEVYEIYLS